MSILALDFSLSLSCGFIITLGPQRLGINGRSKKSIGFLYSRACPVSSPYEKVFLICVIKNKVASTKSLACFEDPMLYTFFSFN
jgi:hypothetical protein